MFDCQGRPISMCDLLVCPLFAKIYGKDFTPPHIFIIIYINIIV